MDSVTPGGPFDIIVFGGNGDLTLRKLLPALYYRDRDGQLPDGARIIAVARTEMGREGYLDRVDKACREQLAGGDFDAVAWDKFRKRLDYVAADASDVDSISALAQQVSDDDQRGRIFYLATAPALFGPACQALQAAKLVTATSRVVLEKPIGHDLASSRKINDEVGAVFPEDRTFRIDHYLGKETVQNLLVLRFANALFERLWHCGEIDHVQITVAETIGVEGRGDYYDRAGALRDMVQNHLLQLLCLIAIEPPVSLDPDVVRDEKLKVLKAVRPISGAEVEAKTVRGQYRAGAVDGVPVPGYLDEIDGDDSATETFVALKVEVDNWRWAGVPFYLRSGKRLPTRFSEIVIQFRPVPHLIFPAVSGSVVANRLVIRLQPNEGITLRTMVKVPEPEGMRLCPGSLDLFYADTFKRRHPDAYERLLSDVIQGNPTLFMRRDEVEAAWRWIEPILDGWRMHDQRPKPYTAGTWGPSASIALIERDERTWYEDTG